MPEFVLNDDQHYNSYGFRVSTAGIDLSRFLANPVMLDGHINSNNAVIGRWKNIAVKEGRLHAEPEFDLEDENAKKIAGKVDRGFIKGASMGLLLDPAHFTAEANGKLNLTKSELIESSIVPVPSNAGAIRLYVNRDGNLHLLNEKELQLTIQNLDIKFLHKTNNMKKVFLSVFALTALGLDKHNTAEGVDVELVERGVIDLQGKLTTLQTELSTTKTALQALQNSAAEAKKLAATKLVDDAIAAGKIDATAKAEWLQLALTNEALASTTLAALPAKTSLAAAVNNTAAVPGEIKTPDDFEKLSLAEQMAFKANNPDAYKKLFA